MCDFISATAEKRRTAPYAFDFVDRKKRDLLVSREGDIERIKSQLSSPPWLDDANRMG